MARIRFSKSLRESLSRSVSFPGIQTEFSPRFDYADRVRENELWMGVAGMRVGVRRAESSGYGPQEICGQLVTGGMCNPRVPRLLDVLVRP